MRIQFAIVTLLAKNGDAKQEVYRVLKSIHKSSFLLRFSHDFWATFGRVWFQIWGRLLCLLPPNKTAQSFLCALSCQWFQRLCHSSISLLGQLIFFAIFATSFKCDF